MKTVLFFIFTLSQISFLMASECRINTEKAYFIDLEGEPIGDPGSKAYRIEYERRETFTPDPPTEVSINFPFEGDCSELLVFKVEVYAQHGPAKFPKDNHSHSGKGLNLIWQKKPLFSGKKELVLKDQVASLKTFNIAQLMGKAPKGKHTWKLKFIISYQQSAGITKIYEKIAESPLMH